MRLAAYTLAALLAAAGQASALSIVPTTVIPVPKPIPVYPGCPTPVVGPWVATPGVQATNHVWYVDPVNGNNINDGTTLATAWHDVTSLISSVAGGGGTNAHPRLVSVDAVNGVVHGGDEVLLANGSYGSVDLNSTGAVNSPEVTLAAMPGATPTFSFFEISTMGGFIVKGIKVTGQGTSGNSLVINGTTANPDTDIIFYGNDISAHASINPFIVNWNGNASGTYITSTNVLTVPVGSILPGSPPILPGMQADWDNGFNGPPPNGITIAPYGTNGTTGTGGAGTYALQESGSSTPPLAGMVDYPTVGDAQPFIMSAVDETFWLANSENAIRSTGPNDGTGQTCISLYANRIHDAFFLFIPAAQNMLIEGNQFDHWYKSAIAGMAFNVQIIGNNFYDALSTTTNHPDVIQLINTQVNTLSSMPNIDIENNLYNEHVDPNAPFSNGSFFIFFGGSKWQIAYPNLTIKNNICITSLFYCINISGPVQGGVFANNVGVSPNYTAPYNPQTVKGDLDEEDSTYSVTGSFFTAAGNLETFVLSGNLFVGVEAGFPLVAQNFTPSAYNGAWTVNSLTPFTFTGSISGTTLTVSGTPGGPIGVGELVTGTGVTSGTKILSGSGTTWTVNDSQTVGSETMTVSNTITATNPSVTSDPGPITVTGQLGVQTTNLVIRNNVMNAYSVNDPLSAVGGAGVQFDHNTAAATTGTGAVTGNIITRTLTGNPPAAVNCSTVNCLDTAGNPTLNALAQGALQGTSVWQAWDPSTLQFNLWPLLTVTSLVGQGAPFDAAYTPTTDYRGLPWPNPPSLGASRCYNAIANGC